MIFIKSLLSSALTSLSQLVANAVLFVCVNCVGIFHLWMSEHDLRISNQKREEFSAIRSQKEIKKYQQVHTSFDLECLLVPPLKFILIQPNLYLPCLSWINAVQVTSQVKHPE